MFLVFWPRGMWDLSSMTRDQMCTPCMERRSLNHWTAREVPIHILCVASFVLWQSWLDEIETIWATDLQDLLSALSRKYLLTRPLVHQGLRHYEARRVFNNPTNHLHLQHPGIRLFILNQHILCSNQAYLKCSAGYITWQVCTEQVVIPQNLPIFSLFEWDWPQSFAIVSN